MAMSFAEMLGELFEAEGLSLNAVYTPSVGDPKELKVIATLTDPLEEIGVTRFKGKGAVFDVLRSKLPAPERDATLTVGETSYKIKSHAPPPDDPDGLLWRLDCAPA